MNRFVSLALVLFASVAVANCYGNGAALGAYSGHAAPSAYGSHAAPSAYGGAAVQQVNLASLGNIANLGSIERYLNGGSSAYGSGAGGSYTQPKYVVAASAPSIGPVSSSSHSAAPLIGAGGYGAINAAPGYGAVPASHGYGAAAAPALGYGGSLISAAPSAAGYGAAAPAHHGYGAAAAPALPGYAGAAAPGGYGHHGGAAAPRFSILPASVTEINSGRHSYKTFQTPIRYSTVALPIVASDPIAKLFIPNHAGARGYAGNSAAYGGAAPAALPIGAAY